jgi:predicted acylesterase/phospholipase RssA
MFSGLLAQLYYFVLVPSTILTAIGVIWYGLPQLSLGTLLRAGAVLVCYISASLLQLHLMAASGDTTRPRNTILEVTFSILSWSSALGIMASSEWRTGVGVLSIVGITLTFVAFVWSLRGRLIERNFEELLRRVAHRTNLTDIESGTHHIICATEAQLGETIYFAPDAIRLRGHPPYLADLPTARVVRASAAFPLAFPPVFLKGVPYYLNPIPMIGGISVRYGPLLQSFILVDGGVRDNLGFAWFEDFAPPLDELVVVSAAPNRYRVAPLPSTGSLAELLAVLRIGVLPYNSRERLRRRIVASLLHRRPWTEHAKAAGSILHIEDSPLDLAEMITRKPRSVEPTETDLPPRDLFMPDFRRDQIEVGNQLWESAGPHSETLLDRARAALDFLEAAESKLPFTERDLSGSISSPLAIHSGNNFFTSRNCSAAWHQRTESSGAVKTTFAAIHPAHARNLVLHGYYLACANLHVALDWPLCDRLDSERLDFLFGK